MARLGEAFGPGQRENIRRDERTNPLTVAWQALWAAIMYALAFCIVRGYIAAWDWITYRGLHSWLGPLAGIGAGVCLIAGIILTIEVMDPNWPNPRKATSSTQPLTPLSRERGITERQLRTSKIEPDALRELLALLQEEGDE